MDDVILLSQLNDFIFCPVSIYFHNLYGDQDKYLYQGEKQLAGTKAHQTVDTNTYSTRKNIITSIDVYCDYYRISGKIDIYDLGKKRLTERKKKIVKVYDGYIFQLYGQYFGMKEMGYEVEELCFYSMDDHRTYKIPLPEQDVPMFRKFEKIINDMRSFNMQFFRQDNKKKCLNCIYENACDRGCVDD